LGKRSHGEGKIIMWSDDKCAENNHLIALIRARWIWELRSHKTFMGPQTSHLNRVEAVPLQLWMKRTVLLQFTSLSTILLQYSEPPAVLCNIKCCNILAVKYILTKACDQVMRWS
jgi:hypothetical protein